MSDARPENPNSVGAGDTDTESLYGVSPDGSAETPAAEEDADRSDGISHESPGDSLEG